MFIVRLRERLMSVVFAFAAMLLLSSCAPESPPPERHFTTRDLLIGLSEMPDGWTGCLEQSADYLSTQDSATMAFEADTTMSPRVARHRVYRYRSAQAARGVYQDIVTPGQVGKTPAEWTYRSSIADQSFFTCYDYEGRVPYPVCEWSARYEEYVVIFHSWLIPGYMSLEDMERVVRAIDARMAHYLGKPLPTQEP